MRAVVQRVESASVTSEGEPCGSIGIGLAVLLGVESGDSEKDAEYIAAKIVGMRIFDDERGTPNLSVCDVGGSVLIVSQFTLLGDARKGKRPSYIRAADPDTAVPLYEKVLSLVKPHVPVVSGRFRTHMQISLINDGPFTVLLDSRKAF